jgi:hypothetical protein
VKNFGVELSTGHWQVHTTPIAGLTFYKRGIFIDPQEPESSKEYLRTCIHEATHASRWDLTEQEVVKLERDIAEVLWGLGYRMKRKRTRKASRKT